MSALPTKADIELSFGNVRLVPKADRATLFDHIVCDLAAKEVDRGRPAHPNC
jgi:hypothetical protein